MYGLMKAGQGLASAAVLLLPAAGSLPALPEAQPEPRGAQGCALSFFQINLWQCHGSSLLVHGIQLP